MQKDVPAVGMMREGTLFAIALLGLALVMTNLFEISSEKEELGQENNIVITTFGDVSVVAIKKSYLQNRKKDEPITSENIKIELEPQEGKFAYVGVYEDTGKFLSFLIPAKFRDNFNIKYIGPEERADADSGKSGGIIEDVGRENIRPI